MTDQPSNLGATLSLVVGLLVVGAAIVVAVTGGETAIVTILALIGGSALLGWARARRKP